MRFVNILSFFQKINVIIIIFLNKKRGADGSFHRNVELKYEIFFNRIFSHKKRIIFNKNDFLTTIFSTEQIFEQKRIF